MRMVLTGLATIAVGSPRSWRKRAPYVALCTTAVLFGWLAIRLRSDLLAGAGGRCGQPRQRRSNRRDRRACRRRPTATGRTGPQNGPGGAPVRCRSQKSSSEAIGGGATPEELRLRGDHNRRRDRVVAVARQPLESFRRWGRSTASSGQFADWLSGRQDDGHSPRRP